MEGIKDKLERFYSPIKNYKEGGSDTRYKSWEWCHMFFIKNKKTKNQKKIDQMALQLAFYLASWGMYRGSSYLLQRDYKAHKPAIREILNKKYNLLWNYNPTTENIEKAKKLLFDKDEGIYWKVKKSYTNYYGVEDESSDILTTKILMGTFGCIPAFDRYFKKGLSTYKKNNGNKIDGYSLTQNIENNDGVTFTALAHLAIKHNCDLKLDSNNSYPPMKCLDMYFWQIGYELDVAKNLINENKSDKQKKKLLEKAKKLKICNIEDKKANTEIFKKASDQILKLNIIKKH
ncbi:MAG: hypothetical protein AB7S44_02765 [Spirochaetales bacterium]